MQPLITVVGATGTGKSKLAVDLAKRFNGEVINGDAMQLYRGLPIITNKIPVNEREGIPHHLIDFIELEEEAWRIGKFKKECLRAIQDIHSRGKIPVLVGGTSYYVQSVLFNDALVGEGAEDIFAYGDERRQQPCEEQGSNGIKSTREWAILDAPVEIMLERLREVDPIMAERWHVNEVRKIRRSLEIYLETGKPASEIYAEQMRQRKAAINDVENVAAAGQLRYSTLVFWMHAEREKLYKRLDARVGNMLEQGLISEAQSLFEYLSQQEAQGSHVDMTRGIWVSIGFKEMQPYLTALSAGNSSEKELEALKNTGVDSVKTSTRQYSTRQVQWIRKKLWPALSDIGATDRLYVLDGTDPEAWGSCVTEPTERIVQAFLSNDADLPEPKTLSSLAEETLKEREQNYIKGTTPLQAVALKQITCELCKKTMMGEEQWNIHVRAASHRRALKSAEKRAQRLEYERKHASAGLVDGHAP